jgi:hypothetical protein
VDRHPDSPEPARQRARSAPLATLENAVGSAESEVSSAPFVRCADGNDVGATGDGLLHRQASSDQIVSHSSRFMDTSFRECAPSDAESAVHILAWRLARYNVDGAVCAAVCVRPAPI